MGFSFKNAVLLKNISELLTLEPAAKKDGRRIQEADLGILKNHSVLSANGVIQWVGPHGKLPKKFAGQKIKEYEMKGSTVLPGLIECHTHTIFAGDRADEFEKRNQGVSYQEIAAQGGGILSTMKKTRSASLEALVASGQKRADRFSAQGVTTLEIKSGYALNLTGEVKMLEAAKKIKNLRVITTFLGAHALPPEFKTYADYLDHLTEKVLPVLRRKKLAERVDIFIEKGFFSAPESEKYLARARELGFDLLIHADQLSLSGGSSLAVKMGALSADHLLQIEEKEINQIAKSPLTCVLLPSADLYMKSAYPPARKLIDQGARVALATDFNPGSSPSQDVALVGLLARLEMKMTLPEVISAYTIGAAHALKTASKTGSIEVGKSADFMCTSKSWRELFYEIGNMGVHRTIQAGRTAHHKI